MNDLILCASSFVAVAVSLFAFKKLELTDALNITILALTALAIVWTTVETRKNFSESQISNLRPVILRSGWVNYPEVQFIEDVNEQNKPRFIELANYKNIAKDISGYIIINNRKYKLHFGNEITQKMIEDEKQTVQIGLLKQWGWLPINGKIFALPEKENFIEVNEKNQIYITYQDIEGNSYFTKEDENYSQISGKLQK